MAWRACIIHGRMRSGMEIRVGSSLCRRAARPLGAPGPAVEAGVDFRTGRRVPSSFLWRRPLSARERISDRGGPFVGWNMRETIAGEGRKAP